MRCEPALALFFTDSPIDRAIHAQNNLVRGEAARRIRCAAQFAIDNVADTFQHAPHDALRHDRVAS